MDSCGNCYVVEILGNTIQALRAEGAQHQKLISELSERLATADAAMAAMHAAETETAEVAAAAQAAADAAGNGNGDSAERASVEEALRDRERRPLRDASKDAKAKTEA